MIEIALLGDCTESHCRAKADEFLKQMNVSKYLDQQAVRNLEHVPHTTFRKRANWCARHGYTVEVFEPGEYHEDYVDINRSSPERQGRPMSTHYWNPAPIGIVGAPACYRHHTLCYGVFERERLRAYATVHRVGDLVMLSQFLGHAAHLDNHVMYLLTREIAESQLALGGAGVLYYNRWDSGTDGLRWFKEKVGMHPEDVTWKL